MKRNKIILCVLLLLCGLKEYVNASLTRNALYVILNNNPLRNHWLQILQAVLLLAISLCIFPLLEHSSILMKVRLRQKYQKKISKEVLEKYSRMEFRYFDMTSTYDLCDRTMKVAVDKLYQRDMYRFELMQNIVSSISMILFIIQIAWWSLPFSFLTVLPMVLINHKKAKDMHEMEEKRAYYDRKAKYASNLMLQKDSLMEEKVYRSYPYIKQIWSENFIQSSKAKRAIALHSGKQGAIVNMIYAWAGAPILLFIVWQVMQGRIQLEDYVVLTHSLSVLGLTLTYGITSKLGGIKEAQLFLKDYRMIMGFKECTENTTCNKEEFECLMFEHVSFSYPGTQKKILDDVSFCVKHGENIAIVGVNGAGKSTMIKLILGLYCPDAGRVTINGIDVSSLPASIRIKCVSAVFQDYTKYETSIRENIGYGNLNKITEDAELMKAANKASIKDKIDEMPSGLDTRLGVAYGDGNNLSEGQWQKLNLARLFLSDAGLLVLDEPTAAMDPRAESELYETFLSLSSKKSCILISHRLGSTRICNRILVLKDGKILEEGSHEELMMANGEYATMFRSQSSWYQDTQMQQKVS